MKKKLLFGKKSNLTLETEEDQPDGETPFLQSNFTRLEKDKLELLRDNIVLTKSGISMTGGSLTPMSEYSGTPGMRGSAVRSYNVSQEDVQMKEVLGKGSAGTVYRANYKKTGAEVAVKVVNIFEKDKRKQLVNDLKALTLLSVPDAQGIATIPCPFLVNYFGGFFDEGSAKIVLEYMDRRSLRDAIKKGVRTSSEPVLACLTVQLLNGLAYLHTVARQAHLDIKPENVLMNSKGFAKLSDFGIAKEFAESKQLLQTWVGTLVYMSPERVLSQVYDRSADLWSLGLTLLEVHIGKYPLPVGRSFVELYQFFMNSQTFKPELPASSSANMHDFFGMMLEKDPKNRPTAVKLLGHPWILENFPKGQADYDAFINAL